MANLVRVINSNSHPTTLSDLESGDTVSLPSGVNRIEARFSLALPSGVSLWKNDKVSAQVDEVEEAETAQVESKLVEKEAELEDTKPVVQEQHSKHNHGSRRS